MNKIYTENDLMNEGLKVAILSGNRKLNEKIVKAKMKSLRECHLLVPAIIAKGTDAIKAKLEIVDEDTKEIITEENAHKYVVNLDGQHRREAHKRLQAEARKRQKQIEEGAALLEDEKLYDGQFMFIYSTNPNISIEKILAEINTVTSPWKGGDFVNGAVMMIEKDLPCLKWISELTNEGVSLDAGSKWATFSGKISKATLVKAISGVIPEVLERTSGLERGKRLYQAAKKSFSGEFLKSRVLIDWIVSKYDNTSDEQKPVFTQTMVEFLEQIDRKDADLIEKSKGKKGEESKESIINKRLSKLYGDYIKKLIANAA